MNDITQQHRSTRRMPALFSALLWGGMAASGGALAAVPQIEAGLQYTSFTDSNGDFYVCGNNSDGKFGNGTRANSSPVPLRISQLSNIKEMAAGSSVVLTIDDSQMLRASGSSGYAGISTTLPQHLLSNIVATAAGNFHYLALDNHGNIWARGYNAYGQLGNGTTANSAAFVQVPLNVTITAIAAGGNHSLAIDSYGRVWSWGWNNSGQLGLGSHDNNPHATPVTVSGISSVTKIAAGAAHSLAADDSRRLYAWGGNTFGELGVGSTTHYAVPQLVKSNVTEIAAGIQFSLALDTLGAVWAWGVNLEGQLGIGTTAAKHIPTQIMTSVEDISAGAGHAVARKQDGSVWTWGANRAGELCNNTTTASLTPGQVDIDLFPQTAGGNDIGGNNDSAGDLPDSGGSANNEDAATGGNGDNTENADAGSGDPQVVGICEPAVYSISDSKLTFSALVMELYFPFTDAPNGNYALFTGGSLEMLPGFGDFILSGNLSYSGEVISEAENCHPAYSAKKGTVYFPDIRLPLIGVGPTGAIEGPVSCYDATLKQSVTQPEVFRLNKADETACQ